MNVNQKTFENAIPCILFIFCIGRISAQQTDSLKNAAVSDSNTSKTVMREVAEKFPRTRLLNIEMNQMTPYKYTSKYLGYELGEGEIKSVSQVNISSNLNILKKKKWSMSTLINYQYISTRAEASDIFKNSLDFKEMQHDFHYFSTSLNVGYYSKLFGKTMIYSGTAIVDASDKSFERLRGLVTATMVLKADGKTTMTLGIVGLIDPNAIVPSFLTFTYERKLQNGWTLDFILPKYMYVRKSLGDLSRLSFGTELGGTLFYVYNNDRAFTFNQLDLNTGFLYEKYLGRSFILSAKTGIRYSPSSRVMEKNANYKDFILDGSPKPGIYFNVGLSFNPFKK